MTGPGAPIRVFIALQVSQMARQQLAETIRLLASELPASVRWVDPENIHLTLKFLGDIDPIRLEDVSRAMGLAARGSSPFWVHLAGLGMFPNQKRPRVLWAGMGGDLDELVALQEKVDAAMSELNFPREGRPFSPHLTLGRVRNGISGEVRRRIGAAVACATQEASDPWLVDTLHLERSNLTAKGAIYTSLVSAPLGG